jgi:hypothetical protein
MFVIAKQWWQRIPSRVRAVCMGAPCSHTHGAKYRHAAPCSAQRAPHQLDPCGTLVCTELLALTGCRQRRTLQARIASRMAKRRAAGEAEGGEEGEEEGAGSQAGSKKKARPMNKAQEKVWQRLQSEYGARASKGEAAGRYDEPAAAAADETPCAEVEDI